MKSVYTFGRLEFRKSNSNAAYGIGSRKLKLTSIKNFIFNYIDIPVVVTSQLTPIRV